MSCKFFSDLGLAWQAALKKTEVKLELLTNIDMLSVVEKGIRGVMYHTIHQYAKANNKYMKYYDKNKELWYLKYWDVNNLYGCAVSKKLPVNKFEWIEDTFHFNEDFILNYNEESNEGYFLQADVQYLEKLHELHNDLPFLTKRLKIEKAEKLVVSLYDETEHVIQIKNLKHALNHGLILEKGQSVIRFNQKAWLKPYIDMNTKLRQKAKNNFEKDLLKLINNSVFRRKI